MVEKLQVLIVDDSADDALLLQRQLVKSSLDCEVRLAESRETLHDALMQEPRLDIVFCDYTMPEIGFIEAHRIVRAHDELVPMILVTGTISEEMAADALRTGVQDFIIKGKFLRLKSIVEREIRASRARRQHHQAENKITQLAMMLDQAQVAIIACDLNFAIRFWNSAATELYGWSETDLAVNRLDEILFRHAPEEHRQAFDATLRQGKWQGELAQVTRNGELRVVQCTWTILENEVEEVEGILMTCFDITSKKEREEYFLRNQRVQTMGLLASGMAHDLNNLLSPILLASNLLKSRTKDEQALKLLNTVEQCVNRSSSLIKQALHFTKGQGYEKKIVKVRYLLIEFEELLRGTFPKNINLSVSISKDLPPIMCNPTQFEQAMMNLCVNARDVMPDGGDLRISVRREIVDSDNVSPQLKDLRSGQYVVIEVADSGPGIREDRLYELFVPFKSFKDSPDSSGLGLFTVKNIMTENKGAVMVQNSTVGGASFSLYFPEVSKTGTGRTKARDKKNARGNKEVLLVVDDNSTYLQILKSSLEDNNYVVLTATDGPEAVAKFAQFKNTVRALITNYSLPNLGGLGLMQASRSLNSELPVVMLTANPAGVKVENARDREHLRLLKKPFTGDQLLETLHRSLYA